ncbi:WGR domain-containing protein [Campylobacter curvus]|uniref:WGR domain-containing protein n=1 Tax=Campylobacter curvus TaxID=200 RepID=UPI00037DF666|nr:WGR domain-containing protein [Campylobacter curvus]QKF61125.1 WGR domain-containing protein [Campylobacter curvus]UEB49442.1 WGR domain-containing protein [Campylobacter curvus]
MLEILRFTDEKSDKFWKIEALGCEFALNWGKFGTSGRYEIKEFDSEPECEKQAQKLLASKLKKGYARSELPSGHLYFDTDEFGLHPLTSHPNFRRYFSDAIYYDECDEEAPFGSDDGNDAFKSLQEAFRKGDVQALKFVRDLLEREWDFTYLPPDKNQSDEELKGLAKRDFNGLLGDQIMYSNDQVIIAIAFGEIKISGKMSDKNLALLALDSMERIERLNRLVWGHAGDESFYAATMRRDLMKFMAEQLG